MKDSEDLFLLVKALSKAEKAYFKKFAYKQSGSKDKHNIYLKLFDLLDGQETYNAEKIARKLGRKQRNFNLASAKNYLTNLIMNVLRDYHALDDPDVQIRQLIQDTKIYIDKRLNNQARKSIHKALKLARQNENYLAQLELLTLNELIIPSGKEEYATRERFYHERTSILEVLKNINDLYWLRQKTFLSIYALSGGEIRTEAEQQRLQAIMDHPLLISDEQALAPQAKLYYHTLKAFYFRAINNRETSCFHLHHANRIFEERPALKVIFIRLYLSVFYNLLLTLVLLQRFEEFDEHLTTFHAFTRKADLKMTPHLESTYFSFDLLQLYKNNQAGEFDKGVKLVGPIKEKLSHYTIRLEDRKLNDLYFQINLLYFGKGQYQECLDWLNRLIDEENTRYLNENKYFITRILRIIIHYELGHFQLLDHLIKSTYRALHQVKKPLHFEITMAKYLRKLPHVPEAKELRAHFSALRTELIELSRVPKEAWPLEYFDFISWLDSKIDNKPFGEVVRAKVQQAPAR